mgnify:CR=1 FL=1
MLSLSVLQLLLLPGNTASACAEAFTPYRSTPDKLSNFFKKWFPVP